MEFVLNLAWALCSLGLVWFWLRTSHSNRAPRSAQFLALLMVVVLLLPVISLSDDIIAMQSPAETDCCLRRALHADEGHPSVVPVSLALTDEILAAILLGGGAQDVFDNYRAIPPAAVSTRALDSRPPPQA